VDILYKSCDTDRVLIIHPSPHQNIPSVTSPTFEELSHLSGSASKIYAGVWNAIISLIYFSSDAILSNVVSDANPWIFHSLSSTPSNTRFCSTKYSVTSFSVSVDSGASTAFSTAASSTSVDGFPPSGVHASAFLFPLLIGCCICACTSGLVVGLCFATSRCRVFTRMTTCLIQVCGWPGRDNSSARLETTRVAGQFLLFITFQVMERFEGRRSRRSWNFWPTPERQRDWSLALSPLQCICQRLRARKKDESRLYGEDIDVPSESTINLLIFHLPQLIQLTMQQWQLLRLEIWFPSVQPLIIPQRIMIHKLFPQILPLVFPPFPRTLHRWKFIPGYTYECATYKAEIVR
jgi:hypothetical protein